MERFRTLLYESPYRWLWWVGSARIGVLFLTLAGGYWLGATWVPGLLLLGIYALALATSLMYLVSLKRSRAVPAGLTWTQMLVDFGVVAATIGFTGGIHSSFTFLLVIVILEAGLLLGFSQGFVFATLAAGFMAVEAALSPQPLFAAPDYRLELWYRFLIEGLAFYLTAFVSGYWNQRINRMEQFQRRILDNMNSGFLMTDAAGAITMLNKAAQQILRLNAQTLIGRPVQEVLQAASGAECPVMTALRSRRNFASYEFQAVTGTGEVKLLGLTTSQVPDTGSGASGIIASFTDLTEISRMRQELQSQDRLAAVGELAAGLAHEVRNPVAAIRGAAEELMASLNAPEVAAKLVAIAKRESDQLNKIVTEFLSFARNPVLHKEVFDLRTLLPEVEDVLRREGPAGNGLRVVTRVPEAPCEMSGDQSQIRRVFLNLGQNAIEAMNSSGTLTMSMVRAPGFHEIRFDDDGPGIEPDKVTKIFEPFYTEKEKGVGMGLAICLRIVTAHDGTLRAVSRAGGGATLIVRLPAARRKE